MFFIFSSLLLILKILFFRFGIPFTPTHPTTQPVRARAHPRTCASMDAQTHILPLLKQITLQLCLVFPCAHPEVLIGSEALLWRGGRVHVRFCHQMCRHV